MWPFSKRKPIFSEEENQLIIQAIREAERQTSGEIRLFAEPHCRYVDALDRAVQIFQNLKMSETKLRNAVLFYIARNDRQLAIYADEGIHKAVGEAYWKEAVKKVVTGIKEENIAEHMVHGIESIGLALKTHFPYNSDTDKNELPDEIIFEADLTKKNS